MSNQNTDPLEAAKISDKAMDFPRKAKTPAPIQALAPVEEAAPAAAPAEYKPKSYRVLESRTFLWGGYVTHLSTGGIVSESGYGKEGIQRMIDQGFKLSELDL